MFYLNYNLSAQIAALHVTSLTVLNCLYPLVDRKRHFLGRMTNNVVGILMFFFIFYCNCTNQLKFSPFFSPPLPACLAFHAIMMTGFQETNQL